MRGIRGKNPGQGPSTKPPDKVPVQEPRTRSQGKSPGHVFRSVRARSRKRVLFLGGEEHELEQSGGMGG